MWRPQETVAYAARDLRAAAREQVLFTMLVMIPQLLRHPTWRGTNPNQGAGQGVLLVPGFGCGDRSLELTRRWLRARGYRPSGARIGLNLGCTTELVDRIERRLEKHAETTQRRVILLGQSRGGWLARLVARRRPDLTRGLVMLASPVLDPLGAHPRAVRAAKKLARLSTLGVPGLLTDDCLSGACFRASSQALTAPLPPQVPAVTVYSQSDAIVPWQLCLDPYAERVEVGSGHTGMGLDPDLYTQLEPRLAEWAAGTANSGPGTANSGPGTAKSGPGTAKSGCVITRRGDGHPTPGITGNQRRETT
ncbi:alpha/beta hydrolase [Amycolatopsis palatopharyngis]|uniref:alpha/beta hydrolase n=1 Tax=Amycolatopsis palatopharyngis TaxID=187982 RepID=UPI00319DF80A